MHKVYYKVVFLSIFIKKLLFLLPLSICGVDVGMWDCIEWTSDTFNQTKGIALDGVRIHKNGNTNKTLFSGKPDTYSCKSFQLDNKMVLSSSCL